jgi:hypothetical protein
MADVQAEIVAYETMREKLQAEGHTGDWVLIHEGKLVSIFDSFEDAATVAVERFGRGPYLIRQVGAPPVTLPASVMYFPVGHAKY